jgi:hypothetical protein
MSETAVIVLADRSTVSAIADLGSALGWTRTSLTKRSHVVMANITWSADQTRVGYYEDHCAEVRYLLLEGPGAKSLAEELRAKLDHCDLESTLEQATESSDPGESIRCLGRLSVMAPAEPDPRFIEIWRAKFRHAERAVRRAAIRTAYSLPWPEMAALVEQRLERDNRLAPQLEDLREYLKRT